MGGKTFAFFITGELDEIKFSPTRFFACLISFIDLFQEIHPPV